MVMHGKEFETKENIIQTKKKIEPQLIHFNVLVNYQKPCRLQQAP